MAATQAQIGFGCVLGRLGATLTTIAGAITGSGSPQAVTPASMTSIVVGAILGIDTGVEAVEEAVEVTLAPGPTFTAIFNNSHGGGMNIALYVPLLETIKAAGPLMKMDMKEASNMQSPSTYKEFIAGLRDGGTVTFEGNYVPKGADNSQANLRTDFESGLIQNYCLALPLAGSGIWVFDAYVQDIAPAYPIDDRVTYTGTLKITGKPLLF
jgi:Lambda phage tail tube protein, TTP